MSGQQDTVYPRTHCDLAMEEITENSRRITLGQLTIGKAKVFYWRTDCGVSLPKMGVVVSETREFIIINDSETSQEVACYKEDYEVSSEVSDVYQLISDYFQTHETGDCEVTFTDEESNEFLDFIKLALKYTKLK